MARSLVRKALGELSLLDVQGLQIDKQILAVQTSTSSQGLGFLSELTVSDDLQSAERTISVAVGSSSFIAPLVEAIQEKSLLLYDLGNDDGANTIHSFVLIDGSLAATLILEDQIRPESKDVVQELKRCGYQVGMVCTLRSLVIDSLLRTSGHGWQQRICDLCSQRSRHSP